MSAGSKFKAHEVLKVILKFYCDYYLLWIHILREEYISCGKFASESSEIISIASRLSFRAEHDSKLKRNRIRR